MALRSSLWAVFVMGVLALIGFIAWEQEYQYTLPTPKPVHLKDIRLGDRVDLSFLPGRTIPKNTYIHFYNFECPCSRFNIKEFQSIVRQYSGQVNFIAVLQAGEENPGVLQQFEEKYGLGIKTILDKSGEIAHALGVYSTPQVVILKSDTIFYKGNYNRARFCLSKNTKFAELALTALLSNKTLPDFPAVAGIAYGCELPSNSPSRNRFFNIF